MTRMRTLLAVAVGLLLTVAALNPPLPTRALAMPEAPEAAAPQATPAGRLSQCGGAVTATLSTNDLQMCDQMDVTVNLQPVCPVCAGGVYVVYVQVDAAFEADWMDATAIRSLGELERYSRMDEFEDTDFRVGVVHYNSQLVRTVLQMTDNVSQARGPLGQPPFGHDPHGDFVGAASRALSMLDQAKRNRQENDDVEPCEFIIFFASTKSIFTQDGANMLQAARMIHSKGVTLMVGCPESNPDYCTFTVQMPKERKLYTEHPDGQGLTRMVKGEFEEFIDDGGIRDMYLTQMLGPGLAYIDGSASELPAVSTGADGKTNLKWEWERLTKTDAHSVTFKVAPLQEGTSAIDGMMEIKDKAGKRRQLPMPSMPVTVTGLCLQDTPTPPPPPTPTDTPEPPTETPVPPSPTPVPPTPTPRPKPIYLPVLLSETCVPENQHTDVVLVLDISTSMDQRTHTGLTKLEAMQQAARQFAGGMRLAPDAKGGHDQVGVVGFNSTAWVQVPLSSDAASIVAAIDALDEGQTQFTRLDLGFERGREVLLAPEHIEANSRVMVFLTDGLPNQVPYAEDGTMETTVLRAAQAAKDAGIRVYTITIGQPGETNPDLMRACATSSTLYYHEPDPNQLGAVYSEIAYTFGCPPERHDWSKPWP